MSGRAAVNLPRRLSPSALSRFRSCPKQFFLTDVERAPRKFESSPILTQANAIHDALNQFFGLPPDDRGPENLERALRAVWKRHRKPDSFSSTDEEINSGLDAIQMLRSYGERTDLAARPLAREQWLSTRVEGIELFGKVDRIDRRGPGLDITDYKTGRRALEPEDLRQEPAVQVYVVAAEAECQLPVERVRFVYLALETEVVWEPEREDVEALGERLVSLLQEIRSTEDFAASPGQHCGFCPYRLVCEERQMVSLDALLPDPELAF